MKKFLLVGMVAVTAVGCASPGKRTAVGAGAGAAAGALVGAVVGHQSGNKGKGAVIGAAAGAVVGGTVGNRLDKQAQELQKVAETRRTDEGIITTLKSQLLFASNSSSLERAAVTNINEIGDVLKKYPENRITVVGHTDSRGTAALNKKLSENRAAAVASQLIERGVPGAAIKVMGRGSFEPVLPNDTEAGRARNRRVEILIVADEAKVR